jgi:altronate dehydratase
MTARPDGLLGFARADGPAGARNHVIVLPSVVCAGLAAEAIAGDRAIAIVHQHGCDHVGVDAVQARRVFAGVAASPNVASALILGLGCETIQGHPVTDLAVAAGGRAEFAEIQSCGGSARAVEAGHPAVSRLADEAARASRGPVPWAAFTLGVAASDASQHAATLDALAGLATAAGASLLLAPGEGHYRDGAFRHAIQVGYGERPAGPLSLAPHGGSAAEQHTGLAAAGAQVIVSLRGPRQAPLGSPVAPVISVAGDERTYLALADDFDLGPGPGPGTGAGAAGRADQLWSRAVSVFNGELTAAERRGAREFALSRITRST